MHHHAQLTFVFLVETGFHHVGPDGLDLLTLWSTRLGLPNSGDLFPQLSGSGPKGGIISDECFDPRTSSKGLAPPAGSQCCHVLPRNPLQFKANLSLVAHQAWWLTPVIPELREAEVSRGPFELKIPPKPDSFSYFLHNPAVPQSPLYEWMAEPSTQTIESKTWNTGRPRQMHHLRSRVRDQPGQHDETPSLLKIQKSAGRLKQEDDLCPRVQGCSEL
ncbi:hypothetical protein AAY473_026327 [Plecturocebus cupreus]